METAHNCICHGNHLLTEERVVDQIKWEVRTKIITIGKFRKTKKNIALCDSWGIYGQFLFCFECIDCL